MWLALWLRLHPSLRTKQPTTPFHSATQTFLTTLAQHLGIYPPNHTYVILYPIPQQESGAPEVPHDRRYVRDVPFELPLIF
ncbi:hypothetical protein BJ875DRAFT_452236 [Amylocarpus encephaloides]|uniref:Uncharacterized protein n=1 Tax=Amylocarpus encephaloides TaxID=45428 RepID=A0A9P8C946_9HELO|nr:hypothetical protein BJ875DRAFT_452236 [Amylocarpus encephaloides]